MVRARVTSKGQVTIPVEVRRRLGVEPGDDLVFEVREDRVAFTVVKRVPLSALRGALPATRPYPGRDATRDEVGKRLGARLDQKLAAPPPEKGGAS